MFSYFQDMYKLALQGELQGIWFYASVYLLCVCSYSLWFQLRTRSWPKVKGKIQNISINKFGHVEWVKSDQEYIAEAIYSYDISGNTYQGHRISPWVFVSSHNARFVLEKQIKSIHIDDHGQADVFYNPNNPKKSYLIVAGKAGIIITLCLSLTPLLLYYLKFHA